MSYKEKQIKLVPLRISHNTISQYFCNISFLLKIHCNLKVNTGLLSLQCDSVGNMFSTLEDKFSPNIKLLHLCFLTVISPTRTLGSLCVCGGGGVVLDF